MDKGCIATPKNFLKELKMNAQDFTIVYKFLYNRIDKLKFHELMERGYGREFDVNYLTGKWDDFMSNIASFAVRHPEFLQEAINEIEKTGYKG